MSTEIKWGFGYYDGQVLGWVSSSDDTEAKPYCIFEYDSREEALAAMDQCLKWEEDYKAIMQH